MTRHIITLGGGAFTNMGELTKLDRYALAATRKKKPNVCFIPTASGDALSYIHQFYAAYTKDICTPSHLGLFRREVKDIERFLLKQDLIFVGGGNTVNMLAVWHEHEVDIALARAWQKGIVLAGTSAGAICWYQSGTTDSYGPELKPMRGGLGFLKGSFTPHVSSEKTRLGICRAAIKSGAIDEGYAVDDHVLLHFKNEKLYKVFKADERRKARYVTKSKVTLL
ncbi:MAG: peptidase E [Bacteroidetes bacterium]|nr:peptidase E [Bacteroidota bacterium]